MKKYFSDHSWFTYTCDGAAVKLYIPRAGSTPKCFQPFLFEPATLRLPQLVCPIGCFSWSA